MKAKSHLWLWEFGSYLRYGMLSSYLQHSCVCVCNQRYSHRATSSVRKGLDTLPNTFLLSSKLRYALPWKCMSRDRPAFGQITLHTLYPNWCEEVDTVCSQLLHVSVTRMTVSRPTCPIDSVFFLIWMSFIYLFMFALTTKFISRLRTSGTLIICKSVWWYNYCSVDCSYICEQYLNFENFVYSLFPWSRIHSKHVCRVFYPEAGPSLDMHHQGGNISVF